MKDIYSKAKIIILILLSILLAFLSHPYTVNEVKEITTGEDLLHTLLNKMYLTFGEYGPFLFFLLLASVLIAYQIVIFHRKRNK